VGAFFIGAGAGAGCSCGRASLAWKNRDEESFLEAASDGAWLYMESDGLGVGVTWLVLGPGVLRGRPTADELLFPTALCPLKPAVCSLVWWSAVDPGRELLGVAEGVTLGVDEALSTPTLDFLVEERGVTLLLRNGLTGVTSLYEDAAAALGVVPLLVRVVRVLEELTVEEAVGATASRGVKGVFAAVRVLASVGFSGRGLFRSVRSMGILQCVRL
jgi:hypothetical protein